jgi:DNA-binding transcriptional LysR family regulator
MDLIRAMRSFVAVNDTGGFAAAARSLGFSKALISKQISALEQHLHTRLLNRTTRRHSLTESGSAYLDHCLGIIEQIDTVEAELGELASQPRGLLRINAPLSYGNLHIAPLIAGFLTAYPEVRVEMNLSNAFIDIVEEGFDLTICIGGEPPSSLIARKLAETRFGIFAAPAYIKKYGEPKTVEDLKHHRCLVYGGHGPTPVPFTIAGRSIVPDWIMRSNNGEMLRQVVIDGGGLIHMPYFFVIKDIDAGRLVEIETGGEHRTADILALYPHRRYLPLKVRVFLDYMAEHLTGQGDRPQP